MMGEGDEIIMRRLILRGSDDPKAPKYVNTYF